MFFHHVSIDTKYLKLIRIPKIKKSFLFFSALYEEIDNMFVKPKLKVAAW